MAEQLNMDAIKNYLIKVGYKIEYPILVNAFKQHLYNPDAQTQGKIRTQFKDYVNRLATVSLENNMKFINLRPEFRTPDSADGKTSGKDAIASNNTAPSVKPKTRLEQKQPLTQHNHHQMSRPTPPAITVPRSQTTTTPTQSSPKQNSVAVQHSPSFEIRHDSKASTPQIYQVQHQSINNDQYNQHLQTYQHQQQQLRSSPSQVSPAIMQSMQQHFQYPLPPTIPSPRQPAPPVLQPRFQSSDQHVSPQPQPQRQLLPIVNASTRTSSESLQEPLSNQLSPASAQANLHLRQQQHHRSDSLDTGTRTSLMMPPPPPRPPPRRRQSNVSLFKPSPTKQPIEKSRGELHDLARRGLGRVKEHALKLNSSTSSSDLSALMPMRNNSMKENRLSRDLNNLGNHASALQRNSSHLTNRSRSSHREDESDSSSLQPTDPLKRRWALEASNCNYNGLITLLKDDPKLASHKDIINGYTALHWAAKFGNLDIIKLIAGTHNVSANIKSSAGFTPLHVAHMFNRYEVVELLQKSYKADPNIRDHSGKRAKQYGQQR